ncbi:histidine kinase [Streptomyces sp. NPDC041068]|uniref:sensor histidine kinase n=1 Tax=Streptomyces sp. NPDC041068 TaxID=3155130 RepID=UPI0033E9EF14
MERIRNWLLPLLLAMAQLAYWPGRAVREGDLGAAQLTAGLAIAVVITVGLSLRRSRPVAAALTVETALLIGLLLPEGATLLHALGELVALYSVAVRRPGRTAALIGSVVVLAGTVRSAVLLDPAVEAGSESLVNAAICLTVVGLGRSRRGWLDGRLAAARDLARAESDRGRAATTERRRLARELHDVSAHHLTSVVVTADMALRLADRKPELTPQALRFAADSGRETLAALDRLVAMMRTSAADEESALEERVDELAAGFARLGLRPAVDVAPDLAALTGPVADAAFGIVREALTNALRYAPGASVRVRLRSTDPDGTVHLTVEDDGAAGGTGASAAASGQSAEGAARQRLGSGRGTAGMRERATALDGGLDAGPRADGPGWSVRARLPRATVPTLRHRAARHRALRSVDLSDVAVALAVAVLPIFAILVESPGETALACVPAVAHALPLLWRRRAPWVVLCAVLASAWLAPLALAFGLLSTDVALGLVLAGGVAECVAVYAVAAFAGPAGVTWTAMGVGALGLTLTSLALAAAHGMADLKGDAGFAFLLFLAVLLGMAYMVPMSAVWGLGAVLRARHERVKAIEGHALTATVWAAVAEAYEERRRIAAELRGEVLRHANAVVVRAEEGDLKAVATEARAALSAMRDLLAALREVTGPGNVRDPRPGATEPPSPHEPPTFHKPPTSHEPPTPHKPPKEAPPSLPSPSPSREVLEPSE